MMDISDFEPDVMARAAIGTLSVVTGSAGYQKQNATSFSVSFGSYVRTKQHLLSPRHTEGPLVDSEEPSPMKARFAALYVRYFAVETTGRQPGVLLRFILHHPDRRARSARSNAADVAMAL